MWTKRYCTIIIWTLSLLALLNILTKKKPNDVAMLCLSNKFYGKNYEFNKKLGQILLYTLR